MIVFLELFLFFTIGFVFKEDLRFLTALATSWCSSSKFRRQINLEYYTTMCQNCVETSN